MQFLWSRSYLLGRTTNELTSRSYAWWRPSILFSGTFHAVRSYTIDDIAFDPELAPCVLADGCAKKRGGWLANRGAAGCSMKVDLDSFHHTTMNRWDGRRS